MTEASSSQERCIQESCIVCGGEMRQRVSHETWCCIDCSYWASSYTPFESSNADSTLDEADRFKALGAIRLQNARTILDIVSRYRTLKDAHLCDVGCAYGWFQEVARSSGMITLGIEPDTEPANDAIRRGLNVRTGRFPDSLEPEERFDLITFNDVFEHLPGLDEMLRACHGHLNEKGILVITAPSSRGSMYRIAKLLHALGIGGPFHRLWQRDFPCPHLHYFSPSNLNVLVTRLGFELVHSQDLLSFQLRGLWNRLRMDREASWATSAAIWMSIVILYPFLKLMPSDILLSVYRRESFPAGEPVSRSGTRELA
jgi:SAM-dependent methyltransferase